MIRAILECCAGIDVGKRLVVVCVMTGPAPMGKRGKRPESMGRLMPIWRNCGIGLKTADALMRLWKARAAIGNRSLMCWRRRRGCRSCWQIRKW